MGSEKQRRARNDLPCTTMDDLLPSHDLSTMTKQVITHDNGLVNQTEYLSSCVQPFG